QRTLFKDVHDNKSIYLLDKWLGFRKYQRYSPLVEVRVAELASESNYRESARILSEWTPVSMSHTTVGEIIERVGEAKSNADKTSGDDGDTSATLAEGKNVDSVDAEADGVFVRRTKNRKHHKANHGITYEGCRKNGKLVSLINPQVMLTTQGVNEFWK